MSICVTPRGSVGVVGGISFDRAANGGSTLDASRLYRLRRIRGHLKILCRGPPLEPLNGAEANLGSHREVSLAPTGESAGGYELTGMKHRTADAGEKVDLTESLRIDFPEYLKAQLSEFAHRRKYTQGAAIAHMMDAHRDGDGRPVFYVRPEDKVADRRKVKRARGR